MSVPVSPYPHDQNMITLTFPNVRVKKRYLSILTCMSLIMTELKYFHISGDRFLYIFVKIVSSNIFQTFVFGADPQFLRVVDILWLLALCGICCEYFLPVFQFSLDFANLVKIFRFFLIYTNLSNFYCFWVLIHPQKTFF